ncbi:MAG: hypothetical protein ACC656_09180, partial [Candidatus Heimdallarchaeota archaeon]
FFIMNQMITDGKILASSGHRQRPQARAEVFGTPSQKAGRPNFCPNCAESLASLTNSNFCPNCGQEV